jgi:hypothetical protein
VRVRVRWALRRGQQQKKRFTSKLQHRRQCFFVDSNFFIFTTTPGYKQLKLN